MPEKIIWEGVLMIGFFRFWPDLAGGGKTRFLKFKILLGLELLLLFFGVCQYAFPLHQYLYQGYDLTGSYCTYLTNSDDSGFGPKSENFHDCGMGVV